jgi:Permeases of the drug/metabolite transporter (DMT) superfamily
MLLLVTIFWGTGFIAVKMALDYGFPPSLITTLRMAFACAIMFPIFRKSIICCTKKEMKHGLIAGLMLFGGFILQTAGMQLTIISNSAFLTTTNVIMVPFISWMFLRKRPKTRVFVSVAMGFVGVCILTHAFEANIQFNLGDILCLLSAICWAAQIAYTEIAVKNANADSFSFLELAFTAVFSAAYLLVFDTGKLAAIANLPAGLLACLWLGATCTGYAFWAQSVAQRHMNSSKAVLILSMEAVFASLFSVLLGFENFQFTLALGGGIIMFSIILLELNSRRSAAKQIELRQQ